MYFILDINQGSVNGNLKIIANIKTKFICNGKGKLDKIRLLQNSSAYPISLSWEGDVFYLE
jgi:hypothetical protein